MAIKAKTTTKKATAKKAATAQKAPATKAATPAARRTASGTATPKYDQPGAPWWKKLPLPTPK